MLNPGLRAVDVCFGHSRRIARVSATSGLASTTDLPCAISIFAFGPDGDAELSFSRSKAHIQPSGVWSGHDAYSASTIPQIAPR
jgi:hypothetical protein